MSANLEAKKVVVEDIKAKIQASKSVVFVKFNGLSVAEDTELRREFRKNNVEYKVLKNTLVRRAFNDLGVTDFDADLNGPTSVAFGEDEVGASKVIVEATKKYEEKVSIKSGYIDGVKVDVNGVKGNNLASADAGTYGETNLKPDQFRIRLMKDGRVIVPMYYDEERQGTDGKGTDTWSFESEYWTSQKSNN